jgi:DNA-binding phage protein
MEKGDYLMAAKILARCPTKRLPEVVRLLKEAGVEVDEKIFGEEEDKRRKLRRERLKDERAAIYDRRFWDTQDEFSSALLGAYENGIGISELSKETGLSRTSLYRYIHEKSQPAEKTKELILRGINKLMG